MTLIDFVVWVVWVVLVGIDIILTSIFLDKSITEFVNTDNVGIFIVIICSSPCYFIIILILLLYKKIHGGNKND